MRKSFATSLFCHEKVLACLAIEVPSFANVLAALFSCIPSSYAASFATLRLFFRQPLLTSSFYLYELCMPLCLPLLEHGAAGVGILVDIRLLALFFDHLVACRGRAVSPATSFALYTVSLFVNHEMRLLVLPSSLASRFCGSRCEAKPILLLSQL